MRKDLDFYDKFPRLKKLVVGLEFEEDVSIEQKQKAFRSLVDLLVKKGIYKNDGSIQKWRENTIQYLKEVVNFLEEHDLQQILVDQESFFERFIFTPCGKNTSLFASLREKNGVKDQFHGIPVLVLFNHFSERTGKSAYEKIPKSVAQNFLLEVENFR
jgi:hypothetical protein